MIGGKKGEKGVVLWWFNKGQEHLDLELLCGAKTVSKIDFLLLISLVQVDLVYHISIFIFFLILSPKYPLFHQF